MNTIMRLIELAAWLELLLDVSLKATLLLVMAGLFSLTLRHASASMRHLFWSVVVISLLALPILSLALPNWRVPVLPSFRATVAPPSVNATLGEQVTPQPIESLSMTTEDKLLKPERQRSSKSGREKGMDSWLADTKVEKIPQPIKDDLAIPTAVLNTETKQALPQDTRSYWLWAVLAVWMSGALAVLMRIVIGVAKVRRTMKRAQVIAEPEWMAALWHLSSELQLRRKVVLYRGEEIKLPMTWGLWHSAVLLPEDCLNWSDDVRELVLLHELAHIKRGDCLTQLLGQIACAAYWFNPLVWTAARKLRVERELACDDYVLRVGARASDYASCLVEIARSFGIARSASVVAVGMACSQLESRVRAILNPALSRRGLNRVAIIACCFVVLGLVGPLAAFSPWASAAMLTADGFKQQANKTEEKRDQDQLSQPMPPIELKAEDMLPRDLIEAQVVNEALNVDLPDLADVAPLSVELEAKIAAEAALLSDLVIPGPIVQPRPFQNFPNPQSIPNPNPNPNPNIDIDLHMNFSFDMAQEAARAGSSQSGELSVDEIIRMKMFGVTPEYIEEMKRAGYGNLTVRQLTRLRSLGVNADYLKQVKELGFDKATIDELIKLRTAGVTTDYAKSMSRLGYNVQSIEALTKMKMMGVTPEYVESMKRAGYDNLTAEQLIKLRTHGVTENYARETQSWGFGKLSVEDLAKTRIHGV
ncbi:MAG TPA: M56 family metallopeptidase, partial [Blastocatellia bacterium]|nr:M56 family metallopeptidase [Blastocatellia bacterium]